MPPNLSGQSHPKRSAKTFRATSHEPRLVSNEIQTIEPALSVGRLGCAPPIQDRRSSTKVAALRARRDPANLLPEYDPTFRQIVRGHFHMDAVPDDRSDTKPTHLSCRVGDDPVIVIEHHSEPSVREDLINDAFNGEQFLLCHFQSPTS